MQIDDAFGQALLAHHEGRDGSHMIERDDGFVDSRSCDVYFEPRRAWDAVVRSALRLARGRVVDVGAGAGRVALALQNTGRDVVAIDVSEGAVEVCRRRGVLDARVMPASEVDDSLGSVDTFVMLGANLGLLGSRSRAPRLLRRFARIASPRARIIADTIDPYETDIPEHLAYHERNRGRGRMGGQARLRVRYRMLATPWFDYLFVSRAELLELVRDTGWEIERIIDKPRPGYVAVLHRVG